ncbi:uncharacterized protein [Medicago truncatula]|uniref:uncharacterized protein isoform X3 n=1 Tax=Medicago truncatula TaxID=3880 RepID=UPI0019678FB1|nr:uncharacterized protein LOC25488322 isoform X3 [Medicago truncatula]
MFPNLKFLCIEECDQLQFTLPFHSAGDFLLLESIKIQLCFELKYIFGQHQDVKLASLKELQLSCVPNFIDIFPESSHSMPSPIKGSSNSISKPQSELEQVKSNTFSWSQICCYGYKSRGSSSTKIPLVSEDHPKDCSITLESSSHYPNIWERAQCFSTSRLSHILCNIKKMVLADLPKIKSVFVMSIASKLSLERLYINNCDELEHIIVDIGDGSGGNNWGNNVFPKLKVLHIAYCEKVEYIFGHIDATDHHQNHNNEVTHLHLSALERLVLYKLKSFISMCTKHYRTTLPPLTEVTLVECSKVDMTSIFGDFIVPNYSNKELIANVEHFLSLEKLKVHDSKVENIFCLNEVSEQQMNFGLQDIELHNLPMITCLFKGRKNYFSLKNLTKMNIKGCEKLEFVFSTSIIMCLPQLLHIRIDECKELKHMIEDDLESKKSSNFMATKTVCFPKLQTLVVKKCKMLKYVFPISICKELPELEALVISEAYKLEEIFVCEEGDQKVNMPNLKVAALDNLPSLYQTQEIHFQAVQKCFVQNCKKLSLTSSASTEDRSFYYNHSDYFVREDINSVIKELLEETGDPDTTEDIAAEIEVQVASGHLSTSSQEYGDGQIAIPFFPTSTTDTLTIEDFDIIEYLEITQTNNDQGEDFWDRLSFLNEDAFKKVSSMIQEKFPVASQFASKDFDLYLHMESAFPQFQEEYKGQDNGNENLKAETTKEFASWIEVQAALGQNLTSSQIKMKETLEEEHEFVENVLDLEIPSLVLLPTNSEELINEQSMDQHHISSFLLEDFINEQSMDHQYLMNQPHSLEETDTTVKPSHGNNFVKESENQSIQCCATSEKTAATTFSTFLGTRNEPPIQLVAPKPKRVEEGNTLTNADAASPSPHLELVSSSQEQDVDVRGLQKITKTNNDQFSLNDNAFIQLSSIIEEQFPEDDDFRDSKSKPSPTNSIPLPLTSQTLPMPFEGEVNVLNPSEIVENSSSPCIVKWELEQLVSENYLDNENLSLCTISATENEPPIQVIDHKQKGIKITVEEVTALTNTKTLKSSTYSKSLSSSSQDQSIHEGSTSGTKNDQDIQLVDLKQKMIKSSFEDVDLGDSHERTQINNNQVPLNDDVVMKVSLNIEEQFPKDDEIIISQSKTSPSITSPIESQFPSVPSKDFDMYIHKESLFRRFQEVSKGHCNSNGNLIAQTAKEFAAWIEAEAASRHELTSSQELMNEQKSLGELDATIKPCLETNLEGSASEKLAGATLSTISGTINEPPIQLVSPEKKGNEMSVEEGTTSTCDKKITSTHLEVNDGKICTPSISIVNTEPPPTKDIDIGDSWKTIAMEDINKLIEEDPLFAFEKLLIGQVSISSIRILLQELKSLMESSFDLDHLISNQESKSKLISLFNQLYQHQGLLPSHVKEFIEKVQTLNDYIIKYTTFQQVLKKHNQLLDSKTDLVNKLWSAYSTQTRIDHEISTANARIDDSLYKLMSIQKSWKILRIKEKI